jgi:hypothetical protein
MPRRKFKIGDKVVVTGSPKITFPTGFKDEIGTKRLFRDMVGRVYTVKGFDRLGNVELWPKRLNSVWIEPEFLKLRSRRKKASHELPIPQTPPV